MENFKETLERGLREYHNIVACSWLNTDDQLHEPLKGFSIWPEFKVREIWE